MEVDEKLALDAIKPDKESHIQIDHDICKGLCELRYCLHICPAKLYTYNEELDQIQVEFAGCLECGTCMVGCKYGAISWNYPKGAFGVQYRYG